MCKMVSATQLFTELVLGGQSGSSRAEQGVTAGDGAAAQLWAQAGGAQQVTELVSVRVCKRLPALGYLEHLLLTCTALPTHSRGHSTGIDF